jgi:Transposase DDE domain
MTGIPSGRTLTKTGRLRRSAIDGRTTHHAGYAMSQSRRAMIECIFGWGKQHGTMRKTKHRGIGCVAVDFMLNLIAYNLVRIPNWLHSEAVAHRDRAYKMTANPSLASQKACLTLQAGQSSGQFRIFSADC